MNRIDRRQLLKAASLGLMGGSASGWFPVLADHLAEDPRRRRHCILLWMSGGPSQTDTFDMKPGHANGGEFKENATKTTGLRFSETLPRLAAQSDKLAIVRGLSTQEGDHGRGTYLMRTGHPPLGAIRYPAIGASLGKALGRKNDAVPSYVSIAPYRAFNQAAFGAGFLGPRHAPLTVGATDMGPAAGQPADGYAELRVDGLNLPSGVDGNQMEKRLEIWRGFQDSFLARHPIATARAHNTVYGRAIGLMNSDAAKAFDLSQEPEKVRQAYGRGLFGQGCLMARRWIERGVSFVEIALGGAGGWDTHNQNFPTVRRLSEELDAGWATLMWELEERGLLERTTILWMGEFGRTPRINAQAGRDHFPQAWTCVFAGGGIAGGQAYGKTTDDGMEVSDGKVAVGDILATLCSALGVPPDSQNVSNDGRPINITEGDPIRALLA